MTHNPKEYRVDGYVRTGGNAHFPPGGRSLHDPANHRPVPLAAADRWIDRGPNATELFPNPRDPAPKWRADGRPMAGGKPILFD